MEPQTALIRTSMIMRDYAALTGLSPARERPRRYLWTDAFAVCNLLELYRLTGDRTWRDLALRLIDQVHHVLGRHRDDDRRTGWISGLDGAEGELHPTRGGLRIGKELNERRDGEPIVERLEWDRDGQYFHYLTRWMHALNRAGSVTGEAAYGVWAVELARAAHAAFVYAPAGSGARRMFWKVSIDLTRPLVTAMGQHDPLDGCVTYRELQAASGGTGLATGIAEMEGICRGRDWTTDDPLGIGGLLCDAWRIAQLAERGEIDLLYLLEAVIDGALTGLEAFAEGGGMSSPAAARLAFRELGLAIGLRGGDRLRDWAVRSLPDGTLRSKIGALARYRSLAEEIEEYWLASGNRENGTWREHREISLVMLATSLAPDCFLSV